MKKKYLLFIMAIFCIMGASLPWPFSTVTPSPVKAIQNPGSPNTNPIVSVNQSTRLIQAQATNLNPEILKLGLTAYTHVKKKGLEKKDLITIIDYSKPSSEKRLWVIDVRKSKVLFNTWVSHGKNSGQMRATSFSNQPGSLKSSLGVFVTDNEPYMGGNGYSLRLNGLEPVNSNAYRRAVVIHGAWYANSAVAKKYGQLGRSFGCPAVSPELAKPLINTIKNHTLVFVYYPDKNWLKHSAFLA